MSGYNGYVIFCATYLFIVDAYFKSAICTFILYSCRVFNGDVCL